VDGELQIGGGSSTEAVTVPAAGTLTFVRDNFAFGPGTGLLGAGRIQVGSAATVALHRLATTGPLIVSGDLEVAAAGTAREITLNLSGQLRLLNTLTVSRTATWDSGTITGGVFQIGAEGTLAVQTGSTKTLSNSRLEILGTASHERPHCPP
jgi:hypothetical protein